MESTSKPLAGIEVAVTGRFACMPQTGIADLIGQLGGRFVRTPTEETHLLIVGQGGLPLESDGKPTVVLEKARSLAASGCDLQILTEEAFLERVGMHQGSEGVRRRCTVVQLAQILKLPGERVRSWLKQGLIEPVETVSGLALFDFQQVAAARTLCDLVESGLAPSEIRKGLERLRKLLPDSQAPLLQVSAVESTSRLLVRLENGRLVEPTGQLQLEFNSEESEWDEHARFIAVARSSTDLFADAVALEAAGRCDEAAETYQAALARDGESPVVCFNLGNVLSRLGQPQRAAEMFDRAVRLDPVYVEAWNNLACMLYETGQIEDSMHAFERALRLAPSYADARSNLDVVTRRYRCQPS